MAGKEQIPNRPDFGHCSNNNISASSGSSKASFTGTTHGAQRTSISWITSASPSSWTSNGTCPRMFWTSPGQLLLHRSVRWVQGGGHWGSGGEVRGEPPLSVQGGARLSHRLSTSSASLLVELIQTSSQDVITAQDVVTRAGVIDRWRVQCYGSTILKSVTDWFGLKGTLSSSSSNPQLGSYLLKTRYCRKSCLFYPMKGPWLLKCRHWMQGRAQQFKGSIWVLLLQSNAGGEHWRETLLERGEISFLVLNFRRNSQYLNAVWIQWCSFWGFLTYPHGLGWFVSSFELLSFMVWFLVQASQLLRQLCMQNMVWTYCKRISPEWKQQVWDHLMLFTATPVSPGGEGQRHYYKGNPCSRAEVEELI